jgi:hypothetical protein
VARVSLQVRLGLDEMAVLERLGSGITHTAVVEEALRRFLAMVQDSGHFVQRSRREGRLEQRKVSQQPARRYVIDHALARDLRRISEIHNWPQTELIRQAILSLGEQSPEPAQALCG